MSPHYERKDHYYNKAKNQGLASRAFYKLEEMQKRFRLIQPGAKVLELGCSPGGWMQIIVQKIGPSGKIVGVDLLPLQITLPKQASFLLGDFLDPKIQAQAIFHLEGLADLVLSDLSPNLSGIAFKDQSQSAELVKTVFEVAKTVLKPGGNLVVKIFPGEESKTLTLDFKKAFSEFKVFIPDATRKGSTEVYWIVKGFRGEP